MDYPYKVSILTSCYNRADVISSAILSVQKQTCDKIQHIIIDDGSTDLSFQLIRRLTSRKCKNVEYDLCKHDINMGVGNTLYDMQHLIRGEYVMVLDSDDWYENPTAVEELYNMAKEGDYMALFADYIDRHVFNIVHSKLFKAVHISGLRNMEDSLYYQHMRLIIDKNGFKTGPHNIQFYHMNRTRKDSLELGDPRTITKEYKNIFRIMKDCILIDKPKYDEALDQLETIPLYPPELQRTVRWIIEVCSKRINVSSIEDCELVEPIKLL